MNRKELEKRFDDIAEIAECPACGIELRCPKCEIQMMGEHLWVPLDAIKDILDAYFHGNQ